MQKLSFGSCYIINKIKEKSKFFTLKKFASQDWTTSSIFPSPHGHIPQAVFHDCCIEGYGMYCPVWKNTYIRSLTAKGKHIAGFRYNCESKK